MHAGDDVGHVGRSLHIAAGQHGDDRRGGEDPGQINQIIQHGTTSFFLSADFLYTFETPVLKKGSQKSETIGVLDKDRPDRLS